MPVNQYDEPYINNARQTYVSQHVETPYKQLQEAAERKQLEYNLGEQRADQLETSFLRQQALNKDKGLRDRLVGGYRDQIEKALIETNGDYAEADQLISKIGRDAKQNMANGQLGAIGQNLASQQAYTKDIMDSFAKKDIGITRAQALLADANQRYEGVQEIAQENGIYNGYSGQLAAKEYNADDLLEEASKGYAHDMVERGEWIASGDGYMKKVGSHLEQVPYNDVLNGGRSYLGRHKGLQEDLAQANSLAGREGVEAEKWSHNYIEGAANRMAVKKSYRRYKQLNELKSDPTALYHMKAKAKSNNAALFAAQVTLGGENPSGANHKEFKESAKTDKIAQETAWYKQVNLATGQNFINTKEGDAEGVSNEMNEFLKTKYNTDSSRDAREQFMQDLEHGGFNTTISPQLQKEMAFNLRSLQADEAARINRDQDAVDFADANNKMAVKDKAAQLALADRLGIDPEEAEKMITNSQWSPDTVKERMLGRMKGSLGEGALTEPDSFLGYLGFGDNEGNILDTYAAKGKEQAEEVKVYREFFGNLDNSKRLNEEWQEDYNDNIDAGGETSTKLMAINHAGVIPIRNPVTGEWEDYDTQPLADNFSANLAENGGAILNGKKLIIDNGTLSEEEGGEVSFETIKHDLADGDDNEAVTISKHTRWLSSPVGGAQYVQFTITSNASGKAETVFMKSDNFASSMGMTLSQQHGYDAAMGLSNAKAKGTATAMVYNGQNIAVGGYDSVEEKPFIYVPKDITDNDIKSSKDPYGYAILNVLTKKEGSKYRKYYLSNNEAIKAFTL